MATWNDFMGPLIYVSDQRLYPLSFGLYAFDVQAGSDPALSMGITMAGVAFNDASGHRHLLCRAEVFHSRRHHVRNEIEAMPNVRQVLLGFHQPA